MSQPTLEERVAALEQTVARLVARQPAPGPNDWRSTIGMFKDDPVMREIDEEARKIREADREQFLREEGIDDEP
jgi:hypothetical protein